MFWKNWSWTTRIWTVLGILFVWFTIDTIRALQRRILLNQYSPYCPSNLKQIGLGLQQYMLDYGDQLPPATSGEGWTSTLQPYLKSNQIFHCPFQRFNGWTQSDDPKASNYSDYFFNAQLSERTESSLVMDTRLILVGEGNDGLDIADARYTRSAIPQSWRSDQKSPSFRHEGQANYLFIDGHVKAVKVKDIYTDWSAKGYYFQPPKVSGQSKKNKYRPNFEPFRPKPP